jgi:hypothetical protein
MELLLVLIGHINIRLRYNLYLADDLWFISCVDE